MNLKHFAIAALCALASCEKPSTAGSQAPTAPASPYTSVVSIAAVRDHASPVAWYQSWIGRAPDVTPAPGIAEWQLAGSAWIQVAKDDKSAGSSSMAIGVQDIDAHAKRLAKAGVSHTPIVDHGFIKLFETKDPAGNSIFFVQETTSPAP